MTERKAPHETPTGPARAVLTRRTVLAAAAAAGAGVAASRLLALANEPAFERVPITGTLANSTGLDWVAPLASDAARVSHLLRRFTFGSPAEERAQAQADGYARTLHRLLETKAAAPTALACEESSRQ